MRQKRSFNKDSLRRLLVAFSCAAWLLVAPFAWSADDTDPDPQQTTAAKYFEALFTGNVKQANAICDVPFSLDRKKVLKTREEIEAIHTTIAEKKGKRELPEYTIQKTTEAPPLDANIFAKYVAFRVTVAGEHIDVYVSSGEKPKAIGFSD